MTGKICNRHVSGNKEKGAAGMQEIQDKEKKNLISIIWCLKMRIWGVIQCKSRSNSGTQLMG